MESYKKLNADLVQQLQDYKQKQRLYEVKNMQLIQESLIHQRIIREQKVIIESFVMQNSQDLNLFLGHLVTGHKQNMTVVTEFVQNMLCKLESLLIHISTDNTISRAPARPPQPPVVVVPSPLATTPAPPPTSVTVRAHRSLSPVARRSDRQEEEMDQNQPLDVQSFVTTRRRNHSPRQLDEEEGTGAEKEKVPPCDPVTLPDGMLSTIPETSMDGVNISLPAEEEEDDEEEAESSSETEEEEEEEEVMPEVPAAPEANQENLSIDKVAPFTPNPRKRMISSRSVLSPVDTNREEARVKRTRTPMPRKQPCRRDQREEEEDEQEEATKSSARPKRRAAPQTLAEPSLRDKLRR